jgi:hypothetical protein
MQKRSRVQSRVSLVIAFFCFAVGFGIADMFHLEILYALIVLTGILLWFQYQRWRNRPFSLGHCQTCGYDLTGNESGRCPECGVEVTAK